MAEFDPSLYIGPQTVAPTEYATDEHLYTLARYDKAQGATGHDRMHLNPAGVFMVPLNIHAQVADGVPASSLPWTAPFPLKVLKAELGIEALSAGTCTCDLEIDGSSVLDAPEAVTAGAVADVSPEDGSEDVDQGSTIQITIAPTGGNANGCQAILTCRRR